MKRILLLLPVVFSFLLIAFAFSTVIVWTPSDQDAALAWNLSIMLAPLLALVAQWKLSNERQFHMATVLTVIAIVNTSIVLGSRLGAWTGSDWIQVLSGAGLPNLPGKTVMGGLLLMLLVFMGLKRWWKLPVGLADVLVLGLPLAAVSGRVGCLVAGCCYGIPTESDWGISYGPGTPAFMHQSASGTLAEGATSTTLLFPIQLILIGGNLLIFMTLWLLRRKLSRPGLLAFLGFGLLTLQRFGIEFIREVATNRGSFGLMSGGLKLGQWVVLLMAIGSLVGFCILYLRENKKITTDHSRASTSQLAYALGGMAIGGFLLRDLLTLDEAMVILVSCLPSIVLLGRMLWREHIAGQSVLAPASMLSIATILVIGNPLDTIPIRRPTSDEWKWWMEIAGGGSIGKYKEIDVSRDCDGNTTKEIFITNVSSGGGEVLSNWQRGSTKLQIGVRGTFGNAQSNDTNEFDNNYKYSSIGAIGSFEEEVVGLSLGVFRRHRIFPDKVVNLPGSKTQYLPSLAVRLGRLDRFSLDARLFDELTLGFSNEPLFSSGCNWGFDDPSGRSRLRVGFAVVSSAQSALHVSGQFPWGETGLSGSLSAYLGNATMFSFGLRYRFQER